MINLLIPWLCVLVIVVLLLVGWRKWYKVAGIGFVLLLLVNWHWHVFSFGCCWLDDQKDPDCIRVMTWNVCCSDTTATNDVDGMLSAILEQDADVVFLTEYGDGFRPEIDSVLCKRYPYKGNIANWITWGNLYSRVAIDTCMRIGGEEDGYLFRYDVRMAGCSLRLYCLHLQSNNLVNGETFYPDSIADRGGIERYLVNYKAASKIRREQAELIVRDMMDAPCIVMGDMNDVCGSPCIRVFENAGLRDAWWEGGFGYGATIHRPLPYRIDHVMYGGKNGSESSESSNGLKLKGIKKVSSKGLSDHDALVADFTLRLRFQ